MDSFQATAPAPKENFIALGRTKQGRLYKKHILNEGPLIHPQTKEVIDIDGQFLDTMVKNFDDGMCDIVQVPLANSENEHDESPDRNIGEVIGLEHDGEKLYALVDVRRPDMQDAPGKTLLGASAFMHTDYTDTKTDQKVGPTLLHMAVTNRPYVTGLEDFAEIVAATADNDGETVRLTRANTEEPGSKMTLDEIKAELKKEHNIDLDALETAAKTPPAALSATDDTKLDRNTVLALAAAGVLKDAAGKEVKPEDTEKVTPELVTSAIAELAQNHVQLTAQVQEQKIVVENLAKERADLEIDGLIRAGKVLPAQKETYAELALTNRVLFDKLVPEKPIVALSQELGTTGAEEPTAPQAVEDAIEYYTGEGSVAERDGFVRATAKGGPAKRRRALVTTPQS